MRYARGIDENFEVYQIPIIEKGDWVRLVDRGCYDDWPRTLVEGKVYLVVRDQSEGWGVPDKIGIWDDEAQMVRRMYVGRFEYVERQGDLYDQH